MPSLKNIIATFRGLTTSLPPPPPTPPFSGFLFICCTDPGTQNHLPIREEEFSEAKNKTEEKFDGMKKS